MTLQQVHRWKFLPKTRCVVPQKVRVSSVNIGGGEEVSIVGLDAMKPQRLEDCSARSVVALLAKAPAMRAIEDSDTILKTNEHITSDHMLPHDWFMQHLALRSDVPGVLTYEFELRWAYRDLQRLRSALRVMLGSRQYGGAWTPLRRRISEVAQDAMYYKEEPLIPWILQLLFDDTLLVLGYLEGLPVSLWRLHRHVDRMKFSFDQLTDLNTDVISGLHRILIPLITHAPNLRHMYLMDDPISAAELIAIGRTCKNLEILRLSVSATRARSNHSLSSIPYTSDELCSAFFSGMSMKQVQRAYVKIKEVKVSMPKLRHLYLSYLDNWKKWDFFKMVMHYYKNMEEFLSYSLGLQVPYFENVVCYNAILSGGSMKLKVVELHSQDILLPELEKGLSCLPKLKALRIYTDFDQSKVGRDLLLLSLKAGKNLKDVMEKLPNITELYLQAEGNSSEEHFRAVIYPTLKNVGHRIKVLTIKACIFSPLRINTYYEMLNMCTNLESLRLTFGFLTKKQCSRVTTKLKPMKKLNFFLAQDLTYDTPLLTNPVISNRPKGSAIKLIKDVVSVAPNIQTLFISVDCFVSQTLLKILDLVKLRVLYLIQVVDYTSFPAKIEDENYFRKMIDKFPLLERVAVKPFDTAKLRKRDFSIDFFSEEDDNQVETQYESLYKAVTNWKIWPAMGTAIPLLLMQTS
ncbi:uncharacterized protein Neurochondrin isoform X2 [Panulirus ornatus]|uniref:uncharacterized protein Neurochondrin isoform X2 n=1 Tax=Panulirus ornatus TaxID=150431 RepID=UPI003A844E9F